MTAKDADLAAKLHLPIILRGVNTFDPDLEIECKRISEVIKRYTEDSGVPNIVIVCTGAIGNTVYRVQPYMARVNQREAVRANKSSELSAYIDLGGTVE